MTIYGGASHDDCDDQYPYVIGLLSTYVSPSTFNGGL